MGVKFSNIRPTGTIKSFTISNSVPKYNYGSFNNIIHVDELGSDITGNGSQTLPYQSIDKAVLEFQNGDAIKVNPGSYTMHNANNGKNITMYGYDYNTYVYVDSNFFTGPNTVKLYNINFEVTSSIYSIAKNLDNIDMYNCSVKGDCAFGFSATGYIRFMNIYLENCSIEINSGNNAIFYGEEINATIKNTSANTGFWYKSFLSNWNINSFTETTSLLNCSYDSLWNITNQTWENAGTGLNPDGSQAHIGVYGGTYAWR